MKLPLCKKSNVELIIGINWTEGSRRNYHYSCKGCNIERQRKYRKTKEGKNVYIRYNVSEKGFATKKRLCREYSKTEHGRIKNREKVRKYHQTPKGLKSRIRSQSKRYRGFLFVEMYANPFPESVRTEWHHITDRYVVALPYEIHNRNRHPNAKIHRRKCWPFVKEIYKNPTQIV